MIEWYWVLAICLGFGVWSIVCLILGIAMAAAWAKRPGVAEGSAENVSLDIRPKGAGEFRVQK